MVMTTRETRRCPDEECGGRGRWMAEGFDGPEVAMCCVCDGLGEVTTCVICLDTISLHEADENGGVCDSCRIDAETADAWREQSRIARYA